MKNGLRLPMGLGKENNFKNITFLTLYLKV